MIQNDCELDATLQRFCRVAKIQSGIRKTATPTQFESMSNGYLSEMGRMYDEVVRYLGRQDLRHEEVCTAERYDQTQTVG